MPWPAAIPRLLCWDCGIPTRDDVLAAADEMTAAFAEGAWTITSPASPTTPASSFHTTAERLESRAEYLEMWRRWVLEDDLVIVSCVSSRQMVQVLGKGAAVFVHDVETVVRTHSGDSTEHERETIIFSCQQDGRWLAVHEHVSADPAFASPS